MSSIYNLTPTTIKLWALLEKNRIVTHDMIERYLNVRGINSIRVPVHRLRKIIGYDKIITIPSTGYYLDP